MKNKFIPSAKTWRYLHSTKQMVFSPLPTSFHGNPMFLWSLHTFLLNPHLQPPCSCKATLLNAPPHSYRGNSRPQMASVFPRKRAAGITYCMLWNPETKCEIILSAFPHPAYLLVILLIWLRKLKEEGAQWLIMTVTLTKSRVTNKTNRWTCLWGNI